MAEWIDEWTDEQLQDLQKHLHELYQDAADDLEGIAEEYFTIFKDKRFQKEWKAYEDGKYTREQFREWEMAQIGRGERWEALKDDMAKRMVAANQLAADLMNPFREDIFAENYNWSAYLIEDASHAGRFGDAYKSISFNLLDRNTVKRLSKGEGLTMLPPKARIDYTKDEEWNKKKIQNSLLSSILRGEDIDKMANRLASEVGHMNDVQAVRAARTMCTEAQNAGRQRNYEELEQIGVEVLKEWISTADDRTRESHAHLDGVRVKVKELFPNGLMEPGDHRGEPKEVYNCRCTMRAVFPRYRSGKKKRTKYTRESYEAWKNNKLAESNGGKFTEITSKAIDNVPLAKTEGMTDEEALFIQQKHKELLTHAMNKNASNEVAYIVSNDHKRSHIINGDRHGVILGSAPFGEKQLVMHNHPANTSYSTTDINFFLNDKNVEILSIIKNNGTVEILRKTGYYDFEKCRVIFGRCVGKTRPKTNADYNKVVKSFIGKCQKEGLFEWTSVIF